MKRVLSVALSLVMVLVLMLTVHAAVKEPEITISDAEVTLYDKAETVTIVLNTPACYGIEGVWSVTASGKTNSITLKAIDPSFEVKAGDKLDVATGKVMWNDLAFDQPQSGTNLMVATYEIPAGTPSGSYTVTFTRDVFTGADYNPNDIDVVYSATIRVSKHTCSDSATDRDHLCDDPDCGKQVGSHNYGSKWYSDEETHWQECNCGTTTTPAPHDFTNGDCVCGAKKPRMTGDLDLDGDVDAVDLTLLAQHVAGIAPLTDATALANANVNGDSVIDANDLTMHACYVAGIISDWNQE